MEGSDMFVVECTSTPGNEIELTIDSDTSVGIDACVALSRAVANARVLAEWTAPFVKKGGVSIMYKGAAAKEELDAAQNAMNKLCLGARLIEYPCAWGE